MPLSNDPLFDQTVLELIEHSPTGSVPHTPTYDDALARLHATQQVFNSADHKGGHVTARSLARLPVFFASNFREHLVDGKTETPLESRLSIFDRYVQSLPEAFRPRAEAFRLNVAGRPIHHRAKTDLRDPLHTLFLVPGAGPQPGLPGNYLHGEITEQQIPGKATSWCITLSDSDNDAAIFEAASLSAACDKFQELLDSVPFHLTELEALGFTLR